jgi:hypothetical protein
VSIDCPPQEDEIEVSIFGPGYGESIALHIGAGSWILIDSCIEPNLKIPAFLHYCSKIKIDPKECVRAIVATHWHDDHIRGLSEVLAECPNADFICSDALNCREFLVLASRYGTRPEMSRGLNEFNKILGILGKLGKPPIWAISNRCLFKAKDDQGNSIAEFHALSPSDESVRLSRVEIASLIPEVRAQKRDIIPTLPNHMATVIWAMIKAQNILLGSDLQNHVSNLIGWNAILKSDARPNGIASIFKSSHHGSYNGDNPGIWEQLLAPNPLVMLTPFNCGKVILPSKTDIKRISERTDSAYITAKPIPKRLKRERVVEEFVKGATKDIKIVNSSFGQIRLRRNEPISETTWKIELFGSAMPISSAYR